MNTDLRIVQFDLDDPDGRTLATLPDVRTVPREYEIIIVEGERYQVMESGVVWFPHPSNVLRVTIYVTPLADVEVASESRSRGDKKQSKPK